MYRYCFVLLLFGLVAGPAFSADPPESEQQQESDETPRQSAPAGKAGPRPAAPASSFVPSEKVSADSAVSFPVDI
jgi:hypothetical protein